MAAPCSDQAVCRTAAAGWPRPSRWSLASRVPSRNRMPAGRAWERSSLAGSRMPSPLRAEAAEGDAEGEAQMIGGRLGVVLGLVGRQRCAFGAVDGGLGPGLGVAPGGWAGCLNSTEGSRWDSCSRNALSTVPKMLVSIGDRGKRKSVDVSNLEMQCLDSSELRISLRAAGVH